MNCRPIYNKTNKAIEPQTKNRPRKGRGPKPTLFPSLAEGQLKELSRVFSICEILFCRVNSAMDLETLAARSDPFGNAYYEIKYFGYFKN